MNNQFDGLMTALITPMNADLSVDFEGFKRLLDGQIKGGVDSLLFLGTTGEPATLLLDEELEILKFAVDYVGASSARPHNSVRPRILAGIGSNSTAYAVEMSKKAAALGVDGLLAVTPYYNKCTQDGILEYYKAVCGATDLPVIAYNIPGRTGVAIKPETAEKLAEIPNMYGIKEACGNLAAIQETARRIEGKMALIAGDDCLALPIFALGARGLISVASNAIPAEASKLVKAAIAGDFQTARALQFEMQPFFDALFSEVSPVPIKYACKLLGICEDDLRPPLLKIEPKNAELIKNTLEKITKNI